jgi:hypothetical protein
VLAWAVCRGTHGITGPATNSAGQGTDFPLLRIQVEKGRPMTTPGRLKIQADGRVAGPASIAYNDPFPCVNGSWGSGAMNGVIMHTMVGNLPGTVTVFNEPSYQASAHFGIDQEGNIHQFGPIGKGWIAWAQAAGNAEWYSIEHADNGNPANPLTEAQITASAQLFEALAAFAGFPMQVADSVDGRGYGIHVMGGAAWGGHTCPGPGPRAAQRHTIVDLAKQIQAGASPQPPAPAWQSEALSKAEAIEAEVSALVAMIRSNYQAGQNSHP